MKNNKNIIFLQDKFKKLKLIYNYDIGNSSNNRLKFIKKALENRRYSFKHILLVLNNIYNITKKEFSNKTVNNFYQKMKLIIRKDIIELRQFVKKQRSMKNNSKLYIEPRKETVNISVELKTDNNTSITLSKKIMILVRDWYQKRLELYIGCVLSNITILDVSIKNKNIVITFSCFGLDEDVEVEKTCMADPDDDVNYPLKISNKSYMVIGKKI